jgi:hypothetical protein
MSNEQRGEATIMLGGAEYTLRPTFDALAEMEQKTGSSIVTLMQRFLREDQGGTFSFSAGDVRAVIAAGIRASGTPVPTNLGELILKAGLFKAADRASFFLAYALAGEQRGNAEATPESP